MFAKTPGTCCTIGVKREAEGSGQIKYFGPVEAYFAYPSDKPTRAIILLSDVHSHRSIDTQLLADQFAANGYLTVVPDLFDGNPVAFNLSGKFNITEWLARFSQKEGGSHRQTIDYLKISEGLLSIVAAGY